MTSIETLVWAMFAAVMIAAVFTFVMQNTLASLVKRLLENGADSEEKAKSLNELGYKNVILRAVAEYFAKGGSTVARAIVKVGGEKENADNADLLFVKKTPLSLYLPEENYTKKVKKHVEEKISYPKLAAAIIVLILAAFAASSVIKFLGNYAYGLVDGENRNPVSGVEQGDNSLLNEQQELNEREEELKRLEEEIAREEAEKAKEEADGKAVAAKVENITGENSQN